MSTKEEKKNLIRELLLSSDELTKPELAKSIGVSTVTINALMDELLAAGEIVEVGKEKANIGRPSTIYQVNPEKFLYLLISIVEHDHQLFLEGKLLNGKGAVSIEKAQAFEKMELAFLQQFVSNFLTGLVEKPLAIAISIPGKTVNGTVMVSAWGQLDGWRIEETIAADAQVPVFVENDANLATVGFAHQLGLASDKGIVGLYYPRQSRPGVSIFYNERLLSGKNSLAGEVKYLPFFSRLQDEVYSPEQEAGFTVKILELYTVLLAPQYMLVHMQDIEEVSLQQKLNASLAALGTPVRPELFVSQNYDEHVLTGLLWLAQKDLPFKMRRIQ